MEPPDAGRLLTQEESTASGVRLPDGRTIPWRELRWRWSGAGGPGGQHANTANTRVELVFDVGASAVLGEDERRRIVDKLGRVVRVVAADERSQWRNRRLACSRLSSRLAAALEVLPERQETRPTKRELDRRQAERRRDQERRRARRWDYRPDD